MSTATYKLTTQEARYGICLDKVIFPLDFRDLRYALAKNGYELSPVKDLPPPPALIGFGGEIARIKETRVLADSEAGEIAVTSRLLGEACQSFEDLANIIASELGLDLHSKVKYYQVTVHYRVTTGKTPFEEISKAENKEFMTKFSEIMKEDLSSFSIRLCPKGAVPNSENWFDIAIEPEVIDERFYHVGVVFRSSKRDKTEAFVKNLESNLLKLIGLIEA